MTINTNQINEYPNLPGTVLRINNIPTDTVVNLINLIEITSPSGICLIN
ncbi:hypothetical protein [Anaerophilus nitritogenes]|nr:hypothetical protein [Anaerophilus nitritogenes]